MLSYQSETISLKDIPIMNITQFEAETLINPILLNIFSHFIEEDQVRFGGVCKLWTKIAFLLFMNKVFNYSRCQEKIGIFY